MAKTFSFDPAIDSSFDLFQLHRKRSADPLIGATLRDARLLGPGHGERLSQEVAAVSNANAMNHDFPAMMRSRRRRPTDEIKTQEDHAEYIFLCCA